VVFGGFQEVTSHNFPTPFNLFKPLLTSPNRWPYLPIKGLDGVPFWVWKNKKNLVSVLEKNQNTKNT
jgi:hypothetical protein